MRRLHIKSVRYRIMAAFIGLMCFSLLTLGLLSLYQVAEQSKKDYEAAIDQQLGIVDKAIFHYISNITSNTNMMASLPIIKQADNRIKSYVNENSANGFTAMQSMKNSRYEQEVFKLLQSFRGSHQAIKNASLGVESNGGFVKSPPSKRFNGYDARTRDWYKAAVNAPNQVVLSDIYKTSSNEYVIYSVKAVLDEQNRIKGVISLDFDLKDFSDVLSKVKIGKRGYAILVDAKGSIMAHPKNKQLLGKSISALGIKELQEASDLHPRDFTTRLIDGNKYRIEIVSGENPAMPIYYIAVIEEREFYDSLKRLTIAIGILTVILLSIGLLTTYWISGILAAPLQILGKAADEIASGNLEKRIDLKRDDDVGEIADRFDKMAEALQQSQLHLEDMVSERTMALSHANLELTDLNKTLQSTIQLLERTQGQLVQSEKLASLGTLVAGVAHEVNTPIGVAVTACSFTYEQHLQLMTKYDAGQLSRATLEDYLKKSGEALEMVMRNLERASTLIQSFKQVAVDQSMEISRVIHIKSYIDEVFMTLKPKLMQSQIEVNINCPPDLKLETYPSALFQIITNLVMNSILHAFEPEELGLIELVVIDRDLEWSLIFTDNGKGMSKETVLKAFDPFFTTKRNHGGTGLGLHIVYNIVTMQLGGKIHCESKLGQGARFTMVFSKIKS